MPVDRCRLTDEVESQRRHRVHRAGRTSSGEDIEPRAQTPRRPRPGRGHHRPDPQRSPGIRHPPPDRRHPGAGALGHRRRGSALRRRRRGDRGRTASTSTSPPRPDGRGRTPSARSWPASANTAPPSNKPRACWCWSTASPATPRSPLLKWLSQETNVKLRALAEQIAEDFRASGVAVDSRKDFDHLLL